MRPTSRRSTSGWLLIHAASSSSGLFAVRQGWLSGTNRKPKWLSQRRSFELPRSSVDAAGCCFGSVARQHFLYCLWVRSRSAIADRSSSLLQIASNENRRIGVPSFARRRKPPSAVYGGSAIPYSCAEARAPSQSSRATSPALTWAFAPGAALRRHSEAPIAYQACGPES